MKIIVGSEIIIEQPTKEVINFIAKNTIFKNPEYTKKKRLGFYLGNTPEEIKLYRVIHVTPTIKQIIIPYGYLVDILLLTSFDDIVEYQFKETSLEVDFKPHDVNLRDYQLEAVAKLKSAEFGILQAPAGSGKTQIGIALAFALKKKTLWITHKHDLLVQSKKRAEQFIDSSLIGVIENGKVNVGQITFAVINTLYNLDLTKYRDVWEVIIVDECHHIAGSESQVTMFSKVLNNLCAKHKYGLSATLHRSDGLIKTTFAMIGGIAHVVPDDVVENYVMTASICPVDTGIDLASYIEENNGVIQYNKLLNNLIVDMARNRLIVADLIKNKDQYCLILSERLEHLELLLALLPKELQQQAIFVCGRKNSKKDLIAREEAYQAMRERKLHYIFASYDLSKEGLDIVTLNRLFLVSPKHDQTAIIQSLGRIERICSNKVQPVVYDYVDRGRFAVNKYKKRKTIYNKKKCIYITREEVNL